MRGASGRLLGATNSPSGRLGAAVGTTGGLDLRVANGPRRKSDLSVPSQLILSVLGTLAAVAAVLIAVSLLAPSISTGHEESGSDEDVDESRVLHIEDVDKDA
ncbi:hypothetical protein B2J93_6761 [Marssonina coronariae]|uniref:Uncharacterized protein n=1 Tax=Diplocarpon coronariae TaxID=2795749 RepID=A0A218Z5T3_9HELO|nr:hypothetical protein B2J93_6761 [Marssonina coronariae]